MIDNIAINFPDRVDVSVAPVWFDDIDAWLTPWEKASPRRAEFRLCHHVFMQGHALISVIALHTPEYIDQKCNDICGWAIGKRAEYERWHHVAPAPQYIVQTSMFDEVAK